MPVLTTTKTDFDDRHPPEQEIFDIFLRVLFLPTHAVKTAADSWDHTSRKEIVPEIFFETPTAAAADTNTRQRNIEEIIL